MIDGVQAVFARRRAARRAGLLVVLLLVEVPLQEGAGAAPSRLRPAPRAVAMRRGEAVVMTSPRSTTGCCSGTSSPRWSGSAAASCSAALAVAGRARRRRAGRRAFVGQPARDRSGRAGARDGRGRSASGSGWCSTAPPGTSASLGAARARAVRRRVPDRRGPPEPGGDRRRARGQRGDHAEARRQLARWTVGYWVIVALLVAAAWDMVFKPGL